MPDIDKQKLRELCERATPGPWSTGPAHVVKQQVEVDGCRITTWIAEASISVGNLSGEPYFCAIKNASFIAAARTAIPALLGRIDELETQSRGVDKAMVERALASWYPGEWPHDDCFKAVNPDGTTFADNCRRDMRRTLEAALAVPAQQWRLTQAVRDVLAERQRQIEEEGWTTEHDDGHRDCMLAIAGACYALTGSSQPNLVAIIRRLWLWDWKWWKPTSYRRNLVKAAPLIIAEIERLDRLAAPPAQEQE